MTGLRPERSDVIIRIAMDIKNEVLYRVYFVLFGLILPVAVVLLYRTIDIGIIQGKEWRERGEMLYMEPRPIEAERGNIMAVDGSLLATSIPYFDIYMDPNSTGMQEADFVNNIDSLAYCIANYVDEDLTVGAFRDFLIQQRQDSARFVLIKKGVSFAQKNMMEQFPLFNLGRMRGGFIAIKSSERRRPFGLLAHRTIGFTRQDGSAVGLEGYFDETLGGVEGEQLMFKVDETKDLWLPMNDLTTVEPQSGDDIHTTIDVNVQDIAEEALLRSMNYHNADWGTAVVMDVKTGAIRAMANLGRWKDSWWETRNFAVGRAVEPGSTFKLATIMSLLEDGYISLEDSVNIEKGRTTFYDRTMVDATPFSYTIDSTSIRQAFEISSNVGMAKLVNKYYGENNPMKEKNNAEKFIKRLRSFNLDIPTGIEIEGEDPPYIKDAYSQEDNWSGTTLPWMAIGYELEITPLQLLTFYNAVANGGVMMKPYLVSEISHYGKTKKRFVPTVVNQRIASRQTIEKVQNLLLGVVERGTAYKLKSDQYLFAGKTGTAQVNYRRMSDNTTRVDGYRASFAGYFPADNPVYSCIVMINNPKKNGFYGGDVAGPVFREIADKCYATRLELHDAYNRGPKTVRASYDLPDLDVGAKEDLETVLDFFELPKYGNPNTDFALIQSRSDSVLLQQRNLPDELVPSVVGMGLRDALFVLENRGLKVRFTGMGKVAQQSIKPGTRAKGQVISLRLR
jgi:cell division protein FtsI (penicillin-binding protein 3)